VIVIVWHRLPPFQSRKQPTLDAGTMTRRKLWGPSAEMEDAQTTKYD
jgi:hypothetical protein